MNMEMEEMSRLMNVLSKIRDMQQAISDLGNGTVNESLGRIENLKKMADNAYDSAAGLYDDLNEKYFS